MRSVAIVWSAGIIDAPGTKLCCAKSTLRAVSVETVSFMRMAARLAGAGRGGKRCPTYRGGVARYPAYGKTREQIREHLLAVLVDGMPGPVCSSPMFRHHMPVLHHTDAAGR